MKIKNIFSSGAILATLLMLVPGISQAYSEFSECSPCSGFRSCLKDFTVGVEGLWWKPCISDLDFAALRRQQNQFLFESNRLDYERICPDHEWGIRAHLGWSNKDCGWGLKASYTYFDCKDHESVTSSATNSQYMVSSPVLHPFLADAVGLFSHVKGKWDMNYQEAEALLTYDLSESPCHRISPYFGVAGMVLDQKLKVHLTNANGLFGGDEGFIRWDSEYKGVGLRMGSHCEYTVCNSLKLFVFADGTLLAGDVDNRNDQYVIDTSESDTRTTFYAKDDKCCHFVPGYHIGTGFAYDFDLCGWKISSHLGYEFIMWHNVPNHRVFTGDDSNRSIAHSTSSTSRNLGFQGLFGGINMAF